MSCSVHLRSALPTPMPLARALVVAACAIGSAAPVLAQQATSVEDLAAQATDPTASLMSFQLNDWYTANFHGIDDSLNQVVFRAAIPFALGQHQSHLPHHAAVRHVVAVRGDGLRRHHDLRPHGVQPAVGALGRRHLGHAADGAGRTHHRQVDRGARAGLRQLVLEAIQLGPVRADLLLVRGERQCAGRRPRQPATHFQLPVGRGSLAVARQQRVRLRHREVALGIARCSA